MESDHRPPSKIDGALQTELRGHASREVTVGEDGIKPPTCASKGTALSLSYSPVSWRRQEFNLRPVPVQALLYTELLLRELNHTTCSGTCSPTPSSREGYEIAPTELLVPRLLGGTRTHGLRLRRPTF